jgi:hypothetical protein
MPQLLDRTRLDPLPRADQREHGHSLAMRIEYRRRYCAKPGNVIARNPGNACGAHSSNKRRWFDIVG